MNDELKIYELVDSLKATKKVLVPAQTNGHPGFVAELSVWTDTELESIKKALLIRLKITN